MPHPVYYTISVTVPAAVFTSLIRQSLSIINIVVCICQPWQKYKTQNLLRFFSLDNANDDSRASVRLYTTAQSKHVPSSILNLLTL